MSARVPPTLATLFDAVRSLQMSELHALSIAHKVGGLELTFILKTLRFNLLACRRKVALLKTLCDACYETSQVQDLLERNAEERGNHIAAAAKALRESKARAREVV